MVNCQDRQMRKRPPKFPYGVRPHGCYITLLC